MKLCRFKDKQGEIRVGLVTEDLSVVDLTPVGIHEMQPVLESDEPIASLNETGWQKLPRIPLVEVSLCAPLEQQEVWAAGVTYLRSKTARMEESNFSATAYDRVYEAERPELFFKSLGEKVVGPEEPVGIRRDARWSVPEPELALVLNSRGKIVGCTIGNDMSSRDIEGENLLYLPQAKIYEHSCALGPWLLLGATEAVAREWQIRLGILRGGRPVFSGQTQVGQLKRSFTELADYLFRSQKFPQGAVLLTGTGIVPPDALTLQPGDRVEIEFDGIGLLGNSVTVV